jgi:hypothetical protein
MQTEPEFQGEQQVPYNTIDFLTTSALIFYKTTK